MKSKPLVFLLIVGAKRPLLSTFSSVLKSNLHIGVPYVNYIMKISIMKLPCDMKLATLNEPNKHGGWRGVENLRNVTSRNVLCPKRNRKCHLTQRCVTSRNAIFLGKVIHKLSTSYPQVIHRGIH